MLANIIKLKVLDVIPEADRPNVATRLSPNMLDRMFRLSQGKYARSSQVRFSSMVLRPYSRRVKITDVKLSWSPVV